MFSPRRSMPIPARCRPPCRPMILPQPGPRGTSRSSAPDAEWSAARDGSYGLQQRPAGQRLDRGCQCGSGIKATSITRTARLSGTAFGSISNRSGLAGWRPIGEACVAEAGSDGERAPMGHVGHERRLAQALNHRIVVQQDEGLVLADAGNSFVQRVRQIEAAALPIAGKILCAAIDGAVDFDDAGTANADEGCKLETFLVGAGGQLLR